MNQILIILGYSDIFSKFWIKVNRIIIINFISFAEEKFNRFFLRIRKLRAQNHVFTSNFLNEADFNQEHILLLELIQKFWTHVSLRYNNNEKRFVLRNMNMLMNYPCSLLEWNRLKITINTRSSLSENKTIIIPEFTS